jgi:pyruvate formate lyase activating enzyme
MAHTLQELLDGHSSEAELAMPHAGGDVRCLACGHRCLVRNGKRGVCRVRFNQDGVLKMPWGYVAGMQPDPVEKKPFYHLLPGARALTFGMLGCDFHCPFCQNWISSQALRDPRTETLGQSIQLISPEAVAEEAEQAGAALVVSSYNEPWITAEWARAVFQEARKRNLRTAFVSNGYATPEALAYMRPWMDAIKIDLKSMQSKTYRQLGGVMRVVLDTIQASHASGLWVEVVTLLIPGLNDDPKELWDAARFIASVSPDIPWHVTAYHPDYQMGDHRATNADDLARAVEIGQEAGLHFVYTGNLPGRIKYTEDTICPACKQTIVRRTGYVVLEQKIQPGSACPYCGEKIAGIWR